MMLLLASIYYQTQYPLQAALAALSVQHRLVVCTTLCPTSLPVLHQFVFSTTSCLTPPPVLHHFVSNTTLCPTPLRVQRHRRLSCRRQCSSGLQAVADVAASIKAGFYEIGLAGGVETMSLNAMAWEGGQNPRLETNAHAKSCLSPMGITSENVAAKFGVDRVRMGWMAGLLLLVLQSAA